MFEKTKRKNNRRFFEANELISSKQKNDLTLSNQNAMFKLKESLILVVISTGLVSYP